MINQEKETTKQTPSSKKRKTTIIALIMLFFLVVVWITFFSGDNTIKQSAVNETLQKTVNNAGSDEPTVPSGDTNTPKGFVKIDSGECKIYKETTESVDSVIIGSGSAAGQVGDSFYIASNPIYGWVNNYASDHSKASSDLAYSQVGIGISCSSWTTPKDPGAAFSNRCIREPGQPSTTTWTITLEGPSYLKRLGHERSIFLEGYLTSVSQGGHFDFNCIAED